AASMDAMRRGALEFEAAEVLRGADEPVRAAQACERALLAQPAHAGAIAMLDAIPTQRGDFAAPGRGVAPAAAQTEDDTARRDLELRLAELCQHRIGDAQAAEAAYRRALAIDPNYRPALAALADLCRTAGAWVELGDLLARQLALAPGEPAQAQ